MSTGLCNTLKLNEPSGVTATPKRKKSTWFTLKSMKNEEIFQMEDKTGSVFDLNDGDDFPSNYACICLDGRKVFVNQV